MTNEQIEAIVAQYDKSVAGEDAATCYGVSERTDVGEGAELVQVLYGDDKQHAHPDAYLLASELKQMFISKGFIRCD